MLQLKEACLQHHEMICVHQRLLQRQLCSMLQSSIRIAGIHCVLCSVTDIVSLIDRVQMLDSDYVADAHLTSTGLVCIWAVLLVHGPTPINHYCRLLAMANLMPHLLRSLASMVAAAQAVHGSSTPQALSPKASNTAESVSGTIRSAAHRSQPSQQSVAASAAPPIDTAEIMREIRGHLESACDLILVLSRSDAVVRATVSHPECFRSLLAVLEELPGELLAKLLTAVRNLTEDPHAMRKIQEAKGVAALVSLLKRNTTTSHVALAPTMQLSLLEVCSTLLVVCL